MGGYSGIAKAAKIAFFDIGDALNRLFVPSNLSLKMLLPGTFTRIQHAVASSCDYDDNLTVPLKRRCIARALKCVGALSINPWV
jgi:hypothetical protein